MKRRAGLAYDERMGVMQKVIKLSKRLQILLALAILTVCGAPIVAAQSRIDIVKVHSPGLERNLLGDPADQTVAVYLPDTYQREPQRHFATVYLLHGFADTPVEGVAKIMQEHMDKLLATHRIEPMIVVAPNGLNRFLGSFYVNSEVTGNWEDYIAHDLVAYVDAHYRTLASRESRGISGHSMGGYGALMIGFKHPDVFAYIYAMSPCCTVLEADIGPANAVWSRREQVRTADELPFLLDKDFMLPVTIAMSAAFAPDRDHPPLFGKPAFVPNGKHLAPDPVVLPKFQANIVASAVPRLLSGIFKLKGIYIDYGAEDEFSHIPIGAQALSSILSQSGVPHVLEVYEGNHSSRVRERIETSLLPWFSSRLRR